MSSSSFAKLAAAELVADTSEDQDTAEEKSRSHRNLLLALGALAGTAGLGYMGYHYRNEISNAVRGGSAPWFPSAISNHPVATVTGGLASVIPFAGTRTATNLMAKASPGLSRFAGGAPDASSAANRISAAETLKDKTSPELEAAAKDPQLKLLGATRSGGTASGLLNNAVAQHDHPLRQATGVGLKQKGGRGPLTDIESIQLMEKLPDVLQTVQSNPRGAVASKLKSVLGSGIPAQTRANRLENVLAQVGAQQKVGPRKLWSSVGAAALGYGIPAGYNALFGD